MAKKNNRIEIAQNLGSIAFSKDRPRVAAQDASLQAMLNELKLKVGNDAIEIMKAWYKGWDLANLSS